jgi:hypothetical protein
MKCDRQTGAPSQPGQSRKAAGMIEVPVAEHDGFDCVDVEFEPLEIRRRALG